MDSVQIAESEGIIDQLVLLVKDYSLFNRNDQFSWFLDNLNKPFVDLKVDLILSPHHQVCTYWINS